MRMMGRAGRPKLGNATGGPLLVVVPQRVILGLHHLDHRTTMPPLLSVLRVALTTALILWPRLVAAQADARDPDELFAKGVALH